MAKETSNRYLVLLEKIFFDRYSKGDTKVDFERVDLELAAKKLDMDLPKNLGDVIYYVRYRSSMPQRIIDNQPSNLEWVIEGAGIGKYAFNLVKVNRILPNLKLVSTKIPDATPEIVSAYSLSDEQALLAKVRYNRLIDIFLGITCYSLQNHLRTTVKSIGQIEIDEIYVGIDKKGRQFIVPVQAKGGSDRLGVVQAKQDIDCCGEKFPNLICRSISTQFLDEDLIAIFELTVEDDEVKIIEERHYRLVPHHQISVQDLQSYSAR